MLGAQSDIPSMLHLAIATTCGLSPFTLPLPKLISTEGLCMDPTQNIMLKHRPSAAQQSCCLAFSKSLQISLSL